MMRGVFIILAFMTSASCLSQQRSTIYLFPGQGADARLFDSLTIDPQFKIRVIEYGTPAAGMTMQSFARELSHQIDTTEPFVLVGVSLGGMLCVELSEVIRPTKTIVISSAKNRNELPLRYRFQKSVPIHKLVSGKMMLAGAKWLQPLVERDQRSNKAIFASMLDKKEPVYMERTIGLIINWERTRNNTPIYHIHGSNDHTLPLRKINSPTSVIAKGSHLMTLTRATEVSEAINRILLQ